MTTVTAVVLAHGDEPWLERCVRSLLASAGTDVDVVVVDNDCTSAAAMASVEALPAVTVVRPGSNVGYAAGCNLGAAAARGDVVAFVNSDAEVEPTAVAALAAALRDPGVGLATASVRLADAPDRLNTAGNPWHLTGLVWSGHYGEPADAHTVATEVATVSGAAFAVRRDVWERLGGFDPEWFAYAEDAELSMRAWQQGWRVVFAPDAVVVHHYEFARNRRKSYLLERNRLLNVATLYEARTLLVLAPVLVGFELAVLALAARQGWLAEKLRGYRWILGHRRWLLRRRRLVQSARTRRDRDLAWLFTPTIDAGNVATVAGVGVVNAALAAYWRLARRAL